MNENKFTLNKASNEQYNFNLIENVMNKINNSFDKEKIKASTKEFLHDLKIFTATVGIVSTLVLSAVYSEEIHPKLNEFYSTIGIVDSKEERLAKEEENSKFHKEYVEIEKKIHELSNKIKAAGALFDISTLSFVDAETEVEILKNVFLDVDKYRFIEISTGKEIPDLKAYREELENKEKFEMNM